MNDELKNIIEATSMGKLEKEAVIKSLLNLHSVCDTVIYCNFGRDFTMPKEVYKISEVVKDGYLIGNVYTKPFFAYGYQLKTYR